MTKILQESEKNLIQQNFEYQKIAQKLRLKLTQDADEHSAREAALQHTIDDLTSQLNASRLVCKLTCIRNFMTGC